MKMNVTIDMTPKEAREFLGLPDVSKAQERMMAEIEKRMKAAVDMNDPEAMMKAWMPLGGQPASSSSPEVHVGQRAALCRQRPGRPARTADKSPNSE